MPDQGASTRARGHRGKTPSANPSYTEGALSSIKHKNYMIESKSSVELQTLINRSLNEEKRNKRELFSDLQTHCAGNRTTAKSRVKSYKKHKASTDENNPNGNASKPNGNEDEESSDEEYADSQESLLGDIYKSENQITEYEEQLVLANSKVKSYLKTKK